MHSFKLKIALTSLGFSGALLAAFGIFFFAFAYRTGIERMDTEIRTLAESSLRGAHPPGHWQNFEDSLQFIYGEHGAVRVALCVLDRYEETPFVSANAPQTLSTLLPERPADPTRQRSSPPRGGSIVERLDMDWDDQISAEEFDGPVSDFEHLDADGDGFITFEEAATGNEFLMPPPRRNESTQMREPLFQTLETENGSWRVGTFQSSDIVLLMALDMELFYRDVRRFQTAFIVIVPIALFLLAISGWFLAARAMRPVALVADTAEGITAKDLNKRIPLVGSDIELERLVRVSNDMLERLEKSYRQAVRFSADAAHELQTPLTILQGELDNAIQQAEAGSPEQQRCSTLMEEVSNLKAVVQKLLLLAHADEGRLKLNLQSVDLSELISAAVEDLEIMAPGLSIETSITPGITASVDSALLNQAVRNMTSNAAKYTAPNGSVIFSLEQSEELLRFKLENTAPQIPEEDCALLFERFHRVEKSRTTAGSGLGLSLAREIARAHGGDLVLEPYRDGMVAFSLSLPSD